jgi:hypothetical protein
VETKIPLVLGKIDGQPADLRVTHFRTNRYWGVFINWKPPI